MGGIDAAAIRLRPLAEADAKVIAQSCRQAPDIPRWVMRLSSLDERGARSWIHTRLHRENEGQQVTRAVICPSTEKFFGLVWLGRFDDEARRGELAYWTIATARSRGVAAAAITLMARYGFEELGLIRIQILAPVENVASRRAAVRAGFTEEGTLRKYRKIAGEHTDLVMYSLLDAH